VHWGGDTSVDGVADDPANPSQRLFGNFNQLRKLKAKHPHVKLLVAVGGWTLSTYFSDVAATPASRAKFVTACIDTFIKGNIPYPKDALRWPWQAGGPGSAEGLFDGIDLDWEYPGKDPGNGAHYRPEDRLNATLLFQEFRRQLDALSAQTKQEYLLTAAIPAGHVNSAGSYELADVARELDWINVMTYDFHGPWDPWTNFNSPFALDAADPTPAADRPYWNVLGTVAFYRAQGVPARRSWSACRSTRASTRACRRRTAASTSRSTTPASTPTRSSGTRRRRPRTTISSTWRRSSRPTGSAAAIRAGSRASSATGTGAPASRGSTTPRRSGSSATRIRARCTSARS
jgi:hypothetical protein